MSLTSAEITDLLRRAQLSVVRDYTIARADFYARELGGSDDSPAGLVALCRAALAKEVTIGTDAPEGDEPKAVPEIARASEPESAPEKARAIQAEPEPAPAADEAPEEETHDDTSEAYESWSKKKLLAAATERGLDVNAHNTKAEIIATLRASS